VECKELRELLSYALSLLLKRDYSEKALKEKLLKRFPETPENLVEQAVRELSLQGFIDEYRTVYSYFLSKSEKGWGRRKIAHSLRVKGFREEVIKEVELTFPFDYAPIIKEVRKKYSLKDRRERERARRFLLSRGFTWSEIYHILEQV
jgi:regulatory protein